MLREGTTPRARAAAAPAYGCVSYAHLDAEGRAPLQTGGSTATVAGVVSTSTHGLAYLARPISTSRAPSTSSRTTALFPGSSQPMAPLTPRPMPRVTPTAPWPRTKASSTPPSGNGLPRPDPLAHPRGRRAATGCRRCARCGLGRGARTAARGTCSRRPPLRGLISPHSLEDDDDAWRRLAIRPRCPPRTRVTASVSWLEFFATAADHAEGAETWSVTCAVV